MKVSYLEIYSNRITDLLGEDRSVNFQIKENSDDGVYVKDLTVLVVNNSEEINDILTLGNKTSK